MNLAALQAELLAGHPDTGPYNANDALAAAELNVVNRPAEGGVLGMLEYLVTNRSRTNTGTDITPTSILGRLQSVAEGAVGADLFGATGPTLKLEQIHAAKMFMVLLSSPQVNTFDFLNNEVDAMFTALGGGAGGAKVWKPADITALKGLSTDQQSRAQELGLGRIKTGHVIEARM